MKTLALAKYIARWQQKEFVWGETDCMMFAMGFHDAQTGQTKSKSIYRKYVSKFEAIRFYKNFVSIESWLANNDYALVTDELKDGDFVVVNNKLIDNGYYYWRGSFVTMDEERGLIRIDSSLLTYNSAWRL
jgi:hypothetical protein